MDTSGTAPSQQANGSATSVQQPPSQPLVRRKNHTQNVFSSAPKKKGPPNIINRRAPLQVNGHAPQAPQRLQTPPLNQGRSPSPSQTAAPALERVSGFSDPRVQAQNIPYRDYKVVTTKRDLADGLRYHIMQIAYKDAIDIRNESEFPKPAKLYRRDPRFDPATQKREEEPEEVRDGLTTEQRDDINKRKEARRREREENLAQIAPGVGPSRKNNFKKKTQQVFRPEYTEEDKRRIMNNYEEKLPWHLEDFDNKHCLIGQNQIGSTGMHAAFVQEQAANGQARFRLLPVEKFYQFKPRRVALQQDAKLEEIEKMMKRRGHIPDSIARLEEERIAEHRRQREVKHGRGLFLGEGAKNPSGRQGEDQDLDFEEDFADDEEGDLFGDEEKDEAEKAADKKVKEGYLQANFMDFKDAREYDEEEEREQREEELRKKLGKGFRKALERRERNFNHGSDSEDSSSSDSEDERDRLEAERIKNLKKEEDGIDGKLKSANPSGTNTPSGRKEKHASDRDSRLPKSSSSRTLKRPGSPNLSDASGTDASVSRKKKKTKHTTTTTSQPVSRAISPDNVPRASFTSARSGSDTEGAAMSEGGTTRIRLKGPKGPDSRLSGRNVSPPTSRPASPPPRPSSTQPSAAAPSALPTLDEIRAHIPPEGITVSDFARSLKISKESLKQVIPLIKQVAHTTGGKVMLRAEHIASPSGATPSIKNEGD